MDIPFAHLADYASLTSDQKLNVMGIFTGMQSSNFPYTHPEMYLVAQLEAKLSEYERQFTLDIRIADEDGNEIAGITGQGIVPHPNNALPISMNLIFKLNNVVFPKPGTYGIYIKIDQDTKKELNITVVQRANP